MFKILAFVVILSVVVNAIPAVEEEAKPQGPVLVKETESDLEAGEDSDLKPAETFGFGYYPAVRIGYGGYGGYGGWRYSSGFGGYRGYGGYRRGWSYGGYPTRYYW